MEKAASEFVKECRLMSKLSHPNITQFIGVYHLPDSPMPALVMEMMVTSLHSILDPEPAPPTKSFIPVSLKWSILHNVACGVSFLHNQLPEPIIHRDLSAKNVLLNEGMVAKITDLGMARILPSIEAATMTKTPGASIYMPPEALEDKSRYNVTIDIFSIGVLALFTLSQIFPDPLPAAYMDDSGRMVGRTELERRECYMGEVRNQFQEGHPFIQLIQQCLHNKMEKRPSIREVCMFLEKARAGVKDEEFDTDKLSLIQSLQSKNITLEHHKREKMDEMDAQMEQIGMQKEQLQLHAEEIQALQAEVATLEQSLEVESPELLREPLSLDWRSANDVLSDKLELAAAVMIDGIMYCGGSRPTASSIYMYIPQSGIWSELPRHSSNSFVMTTLKGQLVLAGCIRDATITVWDAIRCEWIHPYPPMPSGHGCSAAVGYKHYLVVACGLEDVKRINYNTAYVFDSSNGNWFNAQSLPLGAHAMSRVVVRDCWYLSAFGKRWDDKNKHIFWAHIPTLIACAISGTISGTNSCQQIWHELPTPPMLSPTLLSLRGQLLLLGGSQFEQDIYRYDKETNQWRVCGRLPVGMRYQCSAVLPSGEIMVVGGQTGDTMANSKRMWIAKLSN